MADFVFACDTILVANPPAPYFTISPPSLSVVEIVAPQFEVEITNPPQLKVVSGPSPSVNIVLPISGPPGPAGSGFTEIYVQALQPSEGSFAWYWFETDGAGNLTGNEYVYDPDGL